MKNLDHIVIAAHSLEQGVDYIRTELGIDIPKGGFHTTMGTHNHLMQLGNEAYLELIAIDPDAEIPAHPRWFGLDEGLMRDSIRHSPRLITWVMNTPDIQNVKQAANFDIGTPTELQRNDLRWQISLTDDGRLLANGLLPYVIQWQSQLHPSNGMADTGCRLQSLIIHHNRIAWIREKLSSIGAENLVEFDELSDSQAPYLSASIETPTGVKTLNSRVVAD